MELSKIINKLQLADGLKNSKTFIELRAGKSIDLEFYKEFDLKINLKFPSLDLSKKEYAIKLKLFFDRLQKLGYTKELVNYYLEKFIMDYKGFGNETLMFSNLTFTDIYPDKSAELYNQEWYQKQVRENANKKNGIYEELESMYRYQRDGKIYYSFHPLPPNEKYMYYDGHNYIPSEKQLEQHNENTDISHTKEQGEIFMQYLNLITENKELREEIDLLKKTIKELIKE